MLYSLDEYDQEDDLDLTDSLDLVDLDLTDSLDLVDLELTDSLDQVDERDLVAVRVGHHR